MVTYQVDGKLTSRSTNTVHIRDLGKLNLILVCWLRLEQIFVNAASKIHIALIVVKSDSKIIISLCDSKSLPHSVERFGATVDRVVELSTTCERSTTKA